MSDVYRWAGWAAVAELFEGMDKSTLPDVGSWLNERADRLWRGWRDASPAAVVIVSNWHPTLTGRASHVLAHNPTQADARTTVAREHGFPTWKAVEDVGAGGFDLSFEAAVDAMLAGEVERLKRALLDTPELVWTRSSFGHRATLLHYIAANGVETERQVTPLNAAELVALLLDAGADPTATMPVYGGQHTTLELLVTSAHPAAAGVTSAVAKLLGPV